MTEQDEFRNEFRHEFAGLVLDATKHRSGAEESMFLTRVVYQKIDAALDRIWCRLTQKKEYITLEQVGELNALIVACEKATGRDVQTKFLLWAKAPTVPQIFRERYDEAVLLLKNKLEGGKNGRTETPGPGPGVASNGQDRPNSVRAQP